MISVEEALEKILREVKPLGTETAPILEALGQVLAEDIDSDIDIPPLDNSAMDGYAVRAEDIRGASQSSPKSLRVIGTVMAGSLPTVAVGPGTAVRIMTGAPVPAGADSVVQFENTDEEARKQEGRPINEVRVFQEITPGKNVRPAGEDISKGPTTLKKGKVIRPGDVGLIASLGRSRVRVTRRPVVAILPTGNELVELDQPLPEGKIYNSNTYSLAALVKRYGGVPRILGIARDDEDSLLENLRGLDADLLLTIGGVSMGDYDLVKDVLKAEGEMLFWKVRVKPGKALTFGKLKGTGTDGRTKTVHHLGLPGNPVSSMVTFELFVRPAILKMMGKKHLDKPMVSAVMEEEVDNHGGRRLYDRAIIERRNGQYHARLTGPQGSNILTSMSLANGLIIVSEDKKLVSKGETVQAIMLDWDEEANTLGEMKI